MPTSSHRLTAGVVYVADGSVLLVREGNGEGGWSLPKGVGEEDESLRSAAEGGSVRETGMALNAGEVAFITEYHFPHSRRHPPQLQFFFVARQSSQGESLLGSGFAEVALVPVDQLRKYVTFRPWLIPLETWLDERTMRYHVFNLDRIEPVIDPSR